MDQNQNTKIFAIPSEVKSTLDSETKATSFNKKAIIGSLFGVGGLVAFVSATSLEGNKDIHSSISEDAKYSDSLPEPQKHHSLSAFEKTFAEERAEQGPGGLFSFENKFYNTYYKEEWDGMSKEERNEYLSSVESRMNVDDGKFSLNHATNHLDHNSSTPGEDVLASFYEHNESTEKILVLDTNHDGIPDLIRTISHDYDNSNSVIDKPFPQEANQEEDSDSSSADNPYKGYDYPDQGKDVHMDMGKPDPAYEIAPDKIEVMPTSETDHLQHYDVDPSSIIVEEHPIDIMGHNDIEILEGHIDHNHIEILEEGIVVNDDHSHPFESLDHTDHNSDISLEHDINDHHFGHDIN